MTWGQTDRASLLARTDDAFLRHAAAPDSLVVVGPSGWACLLPWRPGARHWGGGAFVTPGAAETAESEALALLYELAQERGVAPEWFSTVPGRALTLPVGLEESGAGRWAFLTTTSTDLLPRVGDRSLVELDDRADAELIETFGRAHNPQFEGFPGHGYATVWLGLRDEQGLSAVGALHELGSGAPHLSGLVVRTDLRGQGFGAVLTGELTRRAIAATGVCTLAVYSSNVGAIRLYERLGYAVAHHFHTRELQPRVG